MTRTVGASSETFLSTDRICTVGLARIRLQVSRIKAGCDERFTHSGVGAGNEI
jgi:hypothetical protein